MPDLLDIGLLAVLVAAVLGWAYGRVQEMRKAVDEMPWTTDKSSLDLDWKLRDEYIALAQSGKAKTAELKSKLLDRCALAIQRYVQYQEEVKDFSRVEHLLSSTVKAQQIKIFRDVTAEMEAIEQEANRLEPGWGERIFQEGSEYIKRQREQEARKQQQKRFEAQQKAFREQAERTGEELVAVQPMMQTPEGPKPAGPVMYVPKSQVAQMNIQPQPGAGAHGHSHGANPSQPGSGGGHGHSHGPGGNCSGH